MRYVKLRNRINLIERSTHSMRSIYSIKLKILFDFKVKVKRINLFELKLNSSITLLKIEI